MVDLFYYVYLIYKLLFVNGELDNELKLVDQHDDFGIVHKHDDGHEHELLSIIVFGSVVGQQEQQIVPFDEVDDDGDGDEKVGVEKQRCFVRKVKVVS